jgi:hypothetical protein
MKRIFLFLLLSACTTSSSSSDVAPAASVASVPSAIGAPSAAPSASAAPLVKGNAPAPSALSFCKSINFASEPLSALCAIGQNYDKSHFECAKPLPVNFCGDVVVWGCQYVGPGEKAPKNTYQAGFVRGGVAPKDGEIISDDNLRTRFPRAGIVEGVVVNEAVSGKDEGQKLSTARIKKLVAAGCVVQKNDSTNGSALDCGGWQADVRYADSEQQVIVRAAAPTSPDCTKH